MNNTQLASGDDRVLREYDYEDQWVLAADLSIDDDNVEYDTVGDTLILVVEADGQTYESEIDLPGTEPDVTMNNGVLTVQVAK